MVVDIESVFLLLVDLLKECKYNMQVRSYSQRTIKTCYLKVFFYMWTKKLYNSEIFKLKYKQY